MQASSDGARVAGSAASQRAMSWRVSASSMASVVSRQVRGMVVPGLVLGGAGLGEAVGVGAGLDDVAAEGEAVDDGGAEAGVGEGLGPVNRGWDMFGLGDPCCCLPFSGLSRFRDL